MLGTPGFQIDTPFTRFLARTIIPVPPNGTGTNRRAESGTTRNERACAYVRELAGRSENRTTIR